MQRPLILALMVAMLCVLPNLSAGGEPGRATIRSGALPRGNGSRAGPRRGVPVYRYGYPGQSYYHYPNGYYRPFYPPAVVISPYGHAYYQPRVIEVTEPYFCTLHGAGFVTRAGMLDHLAGTHKFPLESAAFLCPDGADTCIYPVQ